MAKFSFTLVCVSIVLALAATSNANAFHRRDHVDLGRLLKKRAPPDVLGQTSLASPSSSEPVQTTHANSVPAQTSAASASASTAASPSSTNSGLLSSVTGGLLPTGSSVASSSAPFTAPSASSLSSSAPQTSAQASQALATSSAKSTVFMTASSSGVPTPSQTSSTSTSSGVSHTATTAFIVIVALIGASVIVWTIIRKWKFRPSSDFEGRMQPIEWQPGASEDDGHPGRLHRTLSRSSSFHSGSVHGHADDQMRGNGGYGANGTTGLNPIPDHDFTAGPAHLAPVGGYADLARGPSPQPMMQEPLGQAPSFNRAPQYDQYGLPPHHGYGGY